jgi:hypothetical protein
MWSSESIVDYEKTISFIKDGGAEEVMKFDAEEIPVSDNDGKIIATVNKDDLEAVLKNSKCVREFIMSRVYSLDDRLYEFSIVTNKGSMNFVIEKERALWYESGDDVFRYLILDYQIFYDSLTESFHYEKYF